MATSVQFSCPIDGLALGVLDLTPLGDATRDSGGDFTRDPSQHTVMERRDPNAQVAGGR